MSCFAQCVQLPKDHHSALPQIKKPIVICGNNFSGFPAYSFQNYQQIPKATWSIVTNSENSFNNLPISYFAQCVQLHSLPNQLLRTMRTASELPQSDALHNAYSFRVFPISCFAQCVQLPKLAAEHRTTIRTSRQQKSS